MGTVQRIVSHGVPARPIGRVALIGGVDVDASDFLPDEASIGRIRQAIDRYEVERTAVRRNAMWRGPVYVGVVLVLVLVVARVFNRFADPVELWVSTPHVFLYIVGAIAALLAYSWAARPARRLRQSFRSTLLPTIFGFIEGVQYSRGVTPDTFARLPREAVGSFSRETFDDVVSGSHGGFAFELFEADLSRKSGAAAATSFRGVVIAFETVAGFPGTLVATRKGGEVVSFFGGMFGASPLAAIESGIPGLDAVYDFRSDNVDAARPLVHGRLAQALQWLAESWPEEPARIALQEHNGFLLLPTSRNFFELPDIATPLDYDTHVQPIIADMASLLATASLVRKIGDAEAGPA